MFDECGFISVTPIYGVTRRQSGSNSSDIISVETLAIEIPSVLKKI